MQWWLASKKPRDDAIRTAGKCLAGWAKFFKRTLVLENALSQQTQILSLSLMEKIFIK